MPVPHCSLVLPDTNFNSRGRKRNWDQTYPNIIHGTHAQPKWSPTSSFDSLSGGGGGRVAQLPEFLSPGLLGILELAACIKRPVLVVSCFLFLVYCCFLVVFVPFLWSLGGGAGFDVVVVPLELYCNPSNSPSFRQSSN